ncbi:MAG TPA: hypothetical protein VFZ65_11815 [Planctomycetota bacterium]|nr:hypothetical protein [Planctomycetota bacterium]
MRSTGVAFLLPLLVSLASAQGASVQTYGVGCTFNGQQLAIGTTGLPQLGTTFQLTYSGPNLNLVVNVVQPGIALGLGAAASPLPVTLLPLQPPGCWQQTTAEVQTLMALRPIGYYYNFYNLPVPNDPTLIGFQFTAQWFAIAVQCSPVGAPCNFVALPTSNAALMTVGL